MGYRVVLCGHKKKWGHNETHALSSAKLSHKDTSLIPLAPARLISMWDRLFTQSIKIRSGPKGHVFLSLFIHFAVLPLESLFLFLSPSLALCPVSSRDVEDGAVEVVEPEQGSLNELQCGSGSRQQADLLPFSPQRDTIHPRHRPIVIPPHLHRPARWLRLTSLRPPE